MKEQYTQDKLLEILQEVEDPELGYSIVDLGLVYRAEQVEDHIEVDFTLTYFGCPLGGMLEQEIVQTLRAATGIKDVRVRVMWNPPWTIEMASPEVRLDLGYPVSL
ncbi:MAG TPA: metal-sulfur cluster assembly factor [Spirochaetales bacterium]|nr:metal-sulfur cluster assembly factor [Spirochaetales bacterium]HPS14413.1 metal-sulfur cluster assembly factor [Spirochaetales bacterium]